MRIVLILTVLLFSTLTHARNELTAGELTVDPPTLICLGFYWAVDGDDNGNAVCEIQFRERGTEAWRRGLDLWRTNGEVCGTDRFTPPAWTTPNAFAGSLFDLKPDAEYECRLELKDPDGLNGEAIRTVTVRTRPEPVPAAHSRVIELRPGDVKRVPVTQLAQLSPAQPLPKLNGRTFNALPDGTPHGKKSKIENARNGILHAYYGYAMYCDWIWDPKRVAPGDTILVHPGEYKSNRRNYRTSMGYSLWFHGTHFLAEPGTKAQPILIKAQGAGIVFDGDGCDTLFDVTHADHLVFEGITFRNCRIAIKAGDSSRGAAGLRFINCKFENVQIPVLAANKSCTDYQISGCTVDGKASTLIKPGAVVAHRAQLLPADVRPGDIVKLHAGTYSVGEGDDGFAFTTSGTSPKPIVIQAAGDGSVVLDGNGCDTLFDVRSADHVYFEGLTLRNAKITIKAGVQFLNGCTGLTVKRCKIEDVGYGVLGTNGKCRDFYLADNHMRSWKVTKIKGASGQCYDRDHGYGVNVLGMGHAVCYNDISNFWDNLNVTTNGHPDPRFGRPAISIDFYNNVVGRSGDNGGEADGSVRNVRFLRNKCSFTCQPLWGGPIYFIRNIGEPTKYAEHPSGMIAMHNTLGTIGARGGKHSFINNHVKWSYRPNLIKLDVDSPPGTINGNAYNLQKGGKVKQPKFWLLNTASKNVKETDFDTFREKAGIETHGFTFDGNSNALVDKAVLLPNVNDDYVGDGPDIGPYEQGQPRPHYGPRK